MATTDPGFSNARIGDGLQESLAEVEASTPAELHAEPEPPHENDAVALQQLETDRDRLPVSDEAGRRQAGDSGVAGGRVTSQTGTQALRQSSTSA